MEYQPGSVFLDRYVIEEKLGEGAYGQVFRALDLSDNTRVALKMTYADELLMERTAFEAQILEMFKRQSDTRGRQLVVSMKTSFVLDGCVVLVLELLGTNLSKAIAADFVCSYSKLSTIARQTLRFLKMMRQLDVIHGDIKPENMLLQRDMADKIKFADFGLSHASFIPKKNTYIQTLYYRSPEVVMGYDYDHSADTWSMGCTLYECLTKKVLFDVEDESELLHEITSTIGPLSQTFIEHAPNRDVFYRYDEDYQCWLLKSFEAPTKPIGLRRLVKRQCKDFDVDLPDFKSFVELVGGMLRLETYERYRPELCLAHPFVTSYMGDHELSDENMDEIAHICFEMGINRDVMEKAIDDYEKIERNTALRGENKTAIVISCLRNECRRRNIHATLEDFALVSGIAAGHVGRLEKIVGQIQRGGDGKSNGHPTAINAIPRYCSQLGLKGIVVGNAMAMAKRALEEDVTGSANLYSIAAAAIFIAAAERGSKRSAKAIAKVTGASEAAVKRRLKKMFPVAGSLLAE